MARLRLYSTPAKEKSIPRRKVVRALKNALIDLEFLSLEVLTPLDNGSRDILLCQLRLILNQIAAGISPPRVSFINLLGTVPNPNKSFAPVLIGRGNSSE